MLTAVLAAVAAGLGVRWGWWSFGTGFSMLKYAVVGALVSVPLSLLGLWFVVRCRRRGRGWVLLALVVGLTGVWVPLYTLYTARGLPPIHDISTDLDHPPEFVAVLALRAGASNPAAYGGATVAAQQKRYYPDIQPLTLAQPPAQVFPRALAAAQAMGWEVVEASEREGRIEATATTFWFGFKDDVVVRLTPAGAGSRIDVRSVSRVGVSDLGANAQRIRAYLKRLAR
ncbi:MAG: DUF1499 domain-containing protein [Proteobacteria bacterium]|nr:DUF1499 domain-containing protein [Pseudomonadota bacterium]